MVNFLRKNSALFLLLIVILAFCLRFFWLDRAPKGLLIDEAHFGYIAQSLLETGRDEHGRYWPLVFQGFGDQKLPAQAYLLIPFVNFLGLNAIAVRLPSVIAGSILPLVIYWLFKRLRFATEPALFGALIVALSPWTFIMSRFAYEANLGLLFFSLGLVGLVNIGRGNRVGWWLVLSAISFALTWYSYIAFRPVTLLLALGYFSYLLWKRKIKIKLVLLFFAIFILLLTPIFQPKVGRTANARLAQVGIFSDQGLILGINENRTFCDQYLPKFVCYGVWNKITVIGKELAQRFIEVYSPQFLITTGNQANRYQTLENYGQFYLVIWPLIILGFIASIFQIEALKIEDEARVLLWLGLLLTPLSAIMVGAPQKIRLAPLLPFMLILIVLGLQFLWEFIVNQSWRKLMFVGLTLAVFVASVGYFIDFYTVHTHKFDQVYQSYLPELFEKIELYKDDQTKVYIKPFFSDPIMAYAFYQKYPPHLYQQEVELGQVEESGFQHAVALDNYVVSEDPMINLGCRAIDNDQPSLYVTNEKFKKVEYLERVASENGSLYYAYIYDAAQYARLHPEMCL